MAGLSRKRLFFALWPPPEVRAGIERAAAPGLAAGSGRRVALANVHLTLVFLGMVESDRQTCLEQGAASVRVPVFTLELTDTGYWPRPRVWWAGAAQMPPVLLQLVEQLRGLSNACGLNVEDRPYRAHVTLARKVTRPPPASNFASVTWPVQEFVLVESVTAAEGPRYNVLRRWPLPSSG